jgi:hypothetical protein
MRSRYDFFTEGNVLDIDGQTFPDPLAVNYNTGILTKIPIEYRITERNLAKFWTFMYEQYGITDLDDCFLNINGINYIMSLQPNDIIYLLSQDDLIGFIQNQQVGTE